VKRLALACAAAVILTTWPAVLHPTTAVLGTPDLEGVDHLWALWAGLHHGPLVIHTDLVRYPEGYFYIERSLVLLFGLCALLDPKVNAMELGFPYAMTFILNAQKKVQA